MVDMFSPYPLNYHRHIKIQFKDRISGESLCLNEFQEKTGVQYCSSLVFPNEHDFQTAIGLCPWTLLYTSVGKANREKGKRYQNYLVEGYLSPTAIQWAGPGIGYGLFAEAPLDPGAYIGEYTGLVRRLSRSRPDHNAYCVQYPTQLWSMNYYIIDALRCGNETRYINHSSFPNTSVECLLLDGLLHFVFFAKDSIAAGQEITCNYGSDYWQRKTPH